MSARFLLRARPALCAIAVCAMVLPACSASAPPPGRASAGSAGPAVSTTATTAPTTTTTGPAPAFATTVAPVAPSDLGRSWHDGCPLAPDHLRMVRLAYWGFDDRRHDGALVLNATATDAAISVFRRLYDAHFPIRRMDPVDAFDGDDNASMAADNTSAFNCRTAVAPGPPQWSAHAFGEAVDVNPVENPYVQGADVSPPAGTDYLDRSSARPGMAVTGGELTAAFAAAGWSWGGRWSSPDYQHFSATGG